MNAQPSISRRSRAFAQEKAQVLAIDGMTGQLRYLPDKHGDEEMEPGVTWREHLAKGMLLCPIPGCGRFGKVVAGGDRRHHFAHPKGGGSHEHGTGPETLWHLSAKDVLYRWVQSHPHFADWTLHIDDAPITLPDGWRRPDVLAVSPDGTAKVAFEVQYSELKGTDWMARHSFYREAGVIDIWLFAHHGPHWKPANARQRRRRELAWSDPGWVATVQLGGLRQKMLREGVVPLWLDPTTQTVGTPTARFHPAPARPGEHRLESTAYDLPPNKSFPACHIAADALEQCHVNLDTRELITPSRLVHHDETQRLLGDEQARKHEAAARAAAEHAEFEKREEAARKKNEQEQAAAEARQKMPLTEQYPFLFEQSNPPLPAKVPWWQRWWRRA
ncbi:competence protein CoiA family protein [Streptomyces sp. NBC_01433]|uniref:competence protein CoiA family protein n=1 Tax=Streptomyces sp. NBC_01433 TaxID=2903864 RepID=UPI00225BF038|nr:competence protein CoiA family protein [Streptomyces sp. NBC_01433]MCX4681335.1 competence protein CoiA family protein [Streptomyces sp. NBC_01433]MCX4681727.1 competence protein CoiA family protein [Streptomyces sp. NBC_01433]MCX4682411.1 competence protein CoiA family protein [Streptomyces sp. NBC_01433]